MALGDQTRDRAERWRGALVRHFITDGYIYDWALALALIIMNFTVPGPIVRPLERHYTAGDPALSYPSVYVPLSENQKFGLEFAIPGVVGALMQLARRGAGPGGRLLDWHHLMLSTLEAFAVECSFKKWMNLVGRLRPDWFARLSTHDPETIADGRTSYPSGHAAEMFAAMTTLTLYLCAKSRIFVAASPGHFAKAVLCLLPLGLATFITMSRVAGYKHDFSDVNAGMALGLASGAFAYHLNYPRRVL
ncbi:MAG: phosphatidic acid phosphatase type 2/haloperoxidase [Monoraphidium minutum]|nr:MAG: phosphatidic acid phosphatase type 2/haloperoxidase [Monoraphidium minutum]